MAWIGDLHYYGVNHGQIVGDRHPVIQERAIRHTPIVRHVVFLIEGPSNALRAAPLHLPLDVAGMNRLARILDRRKPENAHLACLGIHFEIDDIAAIGGAYAACIHGSASDDWVPCAFNLRGKFLEAHRQLGIDLRLENAVYHIYRLRVDVPYPGGALDHLAPDVLRGIVRGHARGERYTAAARSGGEPYFVGADDHWSNILNWNAKYLRGLHRD